jgi:nitroreductase
MGNEDVDVSLVPTSGDAGEKLRLLLRYAILAPSGHNTQPWLFRMRDQAVELYADPYPRPPGLRSG